MSVFLLVTLVALMLALSASILPLWRHAREGEYLLLGLALLFAIPAGAIGLYVLVGEPQAIDRTPVASDELRAQLVEIANDLERDPSNQDDWFALGMAYKNIESFSSAEHAFRRALYLDEQSSLVKTELSETLILSQAPGTAEEARTLLVDALNTEPNNQKAIWLLGVMAFTGRDFSGAIAHWETLLSILPEDASVRTAIQRQISLARQELGEVPAGRVIQVNLTISQELRETLRGDEPVFVVVQSLNGPATPLAARRLNVGDLPISLSLSDADAMIEGMSISNFSELRLTARVSLSGEVTPQSGDLQGQIEIGASAQVSLLINQRLP